MKIDQRLSEFKLQTYRNTIRLFCDAAFLYANHSYSSSFALAAAAYEEIGKVHVIDRGCDMMCCNPENADELYDLYFKGSWLTDHRHKQRQAFYESNEWMTSKQDHRRRYINSGGLEQTRQQALYVELIGGTVATPQRITREKAFDLLQKCRDAFVDMGDLGFNGFICESTSKSDWEANRALSQIESAFERCSAD